MGVIIKMNIQTREDLNKILSDCSNFGFKIKIYSLWEETRMIDISKEQLNKIIEVLS